MPYESYKTLRIDLRGSLSARIGLNWAKPLHLGDLNLTSPKYGVKVESLIKRKPGCYGNSRRAN